MSSRKIPEGEYISRLTSTGIKFISWEGGFKGSRSYAMLSCDNGHVWVGRVNNILCGRGCRQCAVDSARLGEADTIKRLGASGASFVRWADGAYTNNTSKALMVCRCGYEWSASVNNLLCRSGCPACARDSLRTPEKDAIRRIRARGLEFIRWESGYLNSRSKAVVRCGLGHEWHATVGSLVIKLSGCPSCSRCGYDQSRPGTLYLLRSKSGEWCKIGVSNNYRNRLDSLKARTPFEWDCIELLHCENGQFILLMERYFHEATIAVEFLDKFDGYSEWRKWDPEIVKWFRDWTDVLYKEGDLDTDRPKV